MKTRAPSETAIACAAIVIAIGIAAPVDNGKWVAAVALAGVAGLLIALGYRYLALKKRAQLELTGGEQYRQWPRSTAACRTWQSPPKSTPTSSSAKSPSARLPAGADGDAAEDPQDVE